MHTAWDTEECASTWRHRVLLQAQRQLLFLLAGTPAACKALNLVCCPYPGQAKPSGMGGVPTHPKHHHQYQHPAAGLLGQGRPRCRARSARRAPCCSTGDAQNHILCRAGHLLKRHLLGAAAPSRKCPLTIGLGRCFPYRQIKSVPKGLVSCKYQANLSPPWPFACVYSANCIQLCLPSEHFGVSN